ncbi:cytoskeleton protein RodZ [Bisgaardia hudsonensis]|uniref:Cytoskeleton protein RodZ n=1 Tax=Bisgaardia hudsonensis TaxID=109472 RepID=A0A4R2N311_9PAST|nr:RodZ family helix-turn-helix domain-containing protein [Bisgaardia hudsonensis]QLB12648.1 hypothetical protein A6A11_03015 [Bisgaardia hudsonensis]TCP14192.1 cytoskeleton protein RodZ [Bisgaardia hudsonensis]
MTNNQPQQIELQDKIDIGQQFRQKREELNLSLEDVSKEINLRPSVLSCIENNQLDILSLSPTFVKGYVRNYARFLNLPNTVWEPMLFTLGTSLKNNLGKNIASISQVNLNTSNHRWIGYITALVVFIVISMTALWWWENYQHLNEERDTLVNSYVNGSTSKSANQEKESISKGTAQDSPITIIEKQQDSVKDISSPVATSLENNSLKTVDNVDLNIIKAQKSTDLMTEENNLTIVNDKSIVNTETNLESLTSAQILENEIAKVKQEQDNQLDKNVLEANSEAQMNYELKIEITGPSCWLSVKDSKRNILAQKEYKQGEILTFDKGMPYSLIIGAPANVKITYKGENYPLTVDGRVARFKLQ